MTPGEAQWLLDKCHQPDVDLPDIMDGKDIAAMVETIAAMTYEYAVQVHLEETGQWHQVTEWNADPNPYKPGHAPKHNERIIRRLVSQPEEVQP